MRHGTFNFVYNASPFFPHEKVDYVLHEVLLHRKLRTRIDLLHLELTVSFVPLHKQENPEFLVPSKLNCFMLELPNFETE